MATPDQIADGIITLSEESDFYADLLFRVITKLFPDKDPDDVAHAILDSYKECGS